METIGRLVQIPEIMDTSVYSLLQEDVGSGISEISKVLFFTVWCLPLLNQA